MADQSKSKAQLIAELEALRRRVTELELTELEHRQMEQALRKSEQLLHTALRAAHVYLWSWDIPNDELKLEQYFTSGRKIGTYSSFLEGVHPEDRDKIRQAVSRTLEDNLPYYVEYRDFTPDGDLRWNIAQGVLQRDEVGQPLRLIGVEQDITERKHLEEQLRQAQKMEAIGRLAGGVAHDFNNILTIIFGNCAFLLDNLSQADSLRHDAEQIQTAAERAAALTRHLLAFSRQQILQPQILNLNTVVANIEKMLRRLIGEDIELITRLEPNLGLVKADPGQLEQVILNLVLNARDAMPDGGKLIIETANVYLDAAYTRQHLGAQTGPHLMLAVSDTGVGMNAATRERIFEPFFTTKTIGQGTGLGLATVLGIINQSEGHIWVYSEPGYGATFKVYLPQADETVILAEPEPALVEAIPKSATILLVEDETLLRQIAVRSLEETGYHVLEAESSQAALQCSNTYQGTPDLLITDVIMPGGMNGPQLAKMLISRWPELKVIYMSGYTIDAIAHHGVLELGLNFLQKPFAPKTLVRKVQDVLDAYRRS